MGVWLSIGRILGARLLGKRHDNLLDEAVLSRRVMPLDLDPNIHMTNTKYYFQFDIGRVDLLVSAGLLKTMRQHKSGPALGGVAVRFRKSLKIFQKYETATRLVCWDDKWFYFDQSIRSDGEIYALAFSRIAAVGREGPIAPETIIRAAGHNDNAPPMHSNVGKLDEMSLALKAA